MGRKRVLSDEERKQHKSLQMGKRRRLRPSAWREVFKQRGMNICKVCGYSKSFHSVCLHHKDAKLKTEDISRMMQRPIIDHRLKELDTCVSLCLNCHGEFHGKYGYQGFPYLSDEMIENWKKFGL
jgi:hypothetical protein